MKGYPSFCTKQTNIIITLHQAPSSLIMRLSQVNKILLGSCIVVVPRTFISFVQASLTPLPCLIFSVSFYGGLAIKEYYLSKELEKVDDSRPPPHERAMRARIVQCVLSIRFSLAEQCRLFLAKRLEQERQELLKEGQNLDIKIRDIRKRMTEAWHGNVKESSSFLLP